MQFNNKNKFYAFPLRKNIGCIGFVLGILIISIVLFLGFFIGIFLIGFIALFYIYRFFKNKFRNRNNLKNKSDDITDADYIEISNDYDEKN
jgi:hypothetical protein